MDIILVTPEQVEKYGETHCLVIAPALREGKEVYRAWTLLPGCGASIPVPCLLSRNRERDACALVCLALDVEGPS